ncbi:MAG: FAD binding domain-containing protein [Acetobacteraceae bacterium]|nr:FAD binding domain-containing protein [Acetobacteraceae bacterium]
MKAAPFAYHVAGSAEQAVALLGELAPQGGRILAGGQSLVPIMAFRLAAPEHLIDITRAEELRGCTVDGAALRIGAGTRHAAFQRPVADGPLGRLLAELCRHIAHAPIRARGTFGGSLAHADPASEWCLALATLGGEVVARSRTGTRRIAAEAFFTGIMTTALHEDEVLTEAALPLLPRDARFGFHEVTRRAHDFALAMTLATWRLVDGVIVEPRVGVGGAEPVPRRIPEAEAALAGQPATEPVFARAANAAADCVLPMEDLQADAAFRRDLVRATVRRALAWSVY